MRNMAVERSGHYVIGLMSGTSLDGIDAALIKILDGKEGMEIQPVHFRALPFSRETKDKIMELCSPDISRIEDLSLMNMFLGHLFADAAEKLLDETGFSGDDVLLISSHGQTVYHQPNPVIIDGKEMTSTLQIGDISVIAERTGIMTVGDFRTRDMAVG